ncbi:MAG: hypothetical protein R6U98_09990, partial [Pirellulaceae bacterium]
SKTIPTAAECPCLFISRFLLCCDSQAQDGYNASHDPKTTRTRSSTLGEKIATGLDPHPLAVRVAIASRT